MNEKTYSTPAATFTERAEDYVLEVVLPGIAKDEVELNLEGKTLTLKTASKYNNPAGFKLVAAEFERGDWAMSFDLPEMADPATISAKNSKGILSITIKKRPVAAARRIEIG